MSGILHSRFWGGAAPLTAFPLETGTYVGDGNASKSITTTIDLSNGGMILIGGDQFTSKWIYWMTSAGSTVYEEDVPNTSAGATSSLTMGNNTFSVPLKSNTNGITYWWTAFKKTEGHFDIIDYTGNAANRTISHNLGVAPQFVMAGNTRGSSNNFRISWSNGMTGTDAIGLFGTSTIYSGTDYWNSTVPSSTVVSLGNSTLHNANGSSYTMFVFGGSFCQADWTMAGTANRIVYSGGVARVVWGKITSGNYYWGGTGTPMTGANYTSVEKHLYISGAITFSGDSNMLEVNSGNTRTAGYSVFYNDNVYKSFTVAFL